MSEILSTPLEDGFDLLLVRSKNEHIYASSTYINANGDITKLIVHSAQSLAGNKLKGFDKNEYGNYQVIFIMILSPNFLMVININWIERYVIAGKIIWWCRVVWILVFESFVASFASKAEKPRSNKESIEKSVSRVTVSSLTYSAVLSVQDLHSDNYLDKYHRFW